MANKQQLQSAGDGTAVPAGYIGEVVTGTTSGNFTYVRGTAYNVWTITLNKGIWDVFGTVNQNMATGSDSSTDSLLSISTTSGAHGSATQRVFGGLGGSNIILSTVRSLRITADNTPVFLVSTTYTGAGSVTHTGGGELYAVRRA